ncbi:hypothetical protein [Thalassiella azotivora]
MPFTPYAQSPGRRAWQVTGDVLLVAWVWVWVRVGMQVHEAVVRLAEPGRAIDEGADGVAGALRDAGERASGVPLVGDRLVEPFDAAGAAADTLAAAGRRQVEVVEDLALLLGVLFAVGPIALAVLVWVPGRVRFARRAAAAQRFIDADADLSLFALRAMANQPMHRLARVSDDPVTAWRAGDPAVVRSLALLELRDCGLRPPPMRLGGTGTTRAGRPGPGDPA